MALLVTYYNELGLPPAAGAFDVIVDGTVVAHFATNAKATGYYDETYAVPSALTHGKARSTVKFQATGDGRIAPIFGVRFVKAGEIR
jgi:hypothetical protein